MRKPQAVLIADIHYNNRTIALADAAMQQAIDRALQLDVPLIVAGDLHDTKANMRGECVNAMIETFVHAQRMGVEVVVLTGNHDLLNEKGKEHALAFLEPYAALIDQPMQMHGFHFIPYQATAEAFIEALADVQPGATLIMHQGVSGSDKGEYVYDHSAISKEILADFRTISGHYHRAQDIKCGRPQAGAVGLMSYIGSPYTITFAEANDGPKGFRVLYDDGILEQVETDLRKHVIVEVPVERIDDIQGLRAGQHILGLCPEYRPGDLLWLKISGPRLELAKLSRGKIAKALGIEASFKLDLIPTDSAKVEVQEALPAGEILDQLIGAGAESAENKGLLKALWRKVMS